MDAWWSDLRFAVRFLLRNRGTTLVAVLALALGIGASTAIYGVAPPRQVLQMVLTESSRLVLGATALAAGFLPARRATRVDPAVALRSE